MIKKIILYFLFVLSVKWNAQNVIWAKSFGGYTNDSGNAFALDGNGNIYTIGTFQGTADFDPNAASIYTLSSNGLNDVFVTKLDASGNFLWARSFGGVAQDEASSITLDSFGNIYLTGFFNGIVDFDPGTNSLLYASLGGKDVYVLKLDANGNFLWANQLGANGDDLGNAVSIDASGDLIVAGSFQSLVDFDPSGLVDTLTSSGQSDIFVAKYHPNGNYVWAKKMGGSSDDLVTSMCIDAGSNIFTCGNFSGMADFDPSPFSYTLNSSNNDAFVAKLSAQGNFYWAKQIKNAGTSSGLINSVDTDMSGNLYAGGTFKGTCDFNPTTTSFTLSSAGSSDDIFILKLDPFGSFTWVKQIGSSASETANGIDVDATGNIYAIGSFLGNVDFDPSSSNHLLNSTSISKTDAYMLKLNSTGIFVWAVAIGSSENDVGNKIKVDAQGNVHSMGIFQSNADVDPSAGILYITSNGAYDVFIHKMNQTPLTSGTSLKENKNSYSLFSVFPNPTHDVLSVYSSLSVQKMNLYNMNGELIKIEENSNQLKLQGLESGLYFLIVYFENKQFACKKIIKE